MGWRYGRRGSRKTGGKQPSVFIQPTPTAVKVKRLKFFVAIKIIKADGGGPGPEVGAGR